MVLEHCDLDGLSNILTAFLAFYENREMWQDEVSLANKLLDFICKPTAVALFEVHPDWVERY